MSHRLPQDQEIGSQTGDFTLSGVNHDGRHSLSALLNGKKGAVIIFWSGVCSHCRRYDRYLNSFAKRHPELALAVIASRHGETPAQLQQTISERGLGFLVLHDPGRAVALQWATEQTPRAFLVDVHRTLVYRGAIDNFKYPADPDYAGYLESAIAEFLAGKPLRRAETPSFGCAIQSVYYTLPKHL
ncbi:MAG: redoxin domain-containing protein [Acidobacteriia bacterium]|nr:redoxin domain-containing protein [Terriglobia bacterium]